ncbi:unnamed protein product [Porites lobata]|uniref:G-protein coupled receptors family 1 profile domain-containing protein n=1 Tax=Porites lobata TaxID=104759 RepID=A0ABN8P3Q5_9CNID|nr:unnamed protein product [Porites lobata]
MAAANSTTEGNQKRITEMYCSAEFIGDVDSELIFLSVLNSLLSITAFLGNALILVALHKESSLHPPSKLLYRNLAIADLCVGIIAQPVDVANWMSAVNEGWTICYHTELTAFITSHILCSVSLLTSTAISVDRLLALLLMLKYRQVVTLRRTYLTAIVVWVFCIVATSSYFLNPVMVPWFIYTGISLSLVTSILSYTKIFCTLHQIPLNISRYRNAVSTALWVQVTLVVCYLPYGITVALTPPRDLPSSIYLARQFTATLVFFKSTLNPLLYCWKIREVRQTVKDIIRKHCQTC